MALNKAQTSLGIKIILIILIVAFVASFIPLVGGLFTGNNTNTGTNTNDPLAQANAQYQPTVAALTSQLQSEPTSYTVLVQLGNQYFDWANSVQRVSQTNQSAVGADQPLWVSAKDAYRRALEVRNDEPPVQIDYAITLFYTGETNEAIKVAEATAKASPKFAPAHFNLGIFYKAVGQNDKSIAAFEQSLELEPTGQNADFAKQQVQELKSGGTTGTTQP